MSSPIPPPFPEEQVRLAREELRRSRRGRNWIYFFLIISIGLNFLFFGILGLYLKWSGSKSSSQPFIERYLEGEKDSEDKIAVIRLEGIISSEMDGHMGYDGMVGDIKEQFQMALEDPNVKAIILRINSPGGEVLASDEIYRTVRKARGSKPIVCSMGSLAASGGFYAAMGSQWIIADDLTITGSIGVIMQTLNYKDLFGKIGLKSLVFKSGKFKDLLNGSREPTTEEMALVQNLIMETYDKFLNVVAKERKLDSQGLREGLADGRILSGKQALDAKLIDETGSFQDSIKKAKSLARIPSAKVFDYVAPMTLRHLLGIFAESNKSPKIQIDISPNPIQLQQGKLYYLSLHLF